MLVLGLTGEKIGGKTTLSHYLMDKYGAKHYRFSKILDDLLERLYLPNSRDNQIAIVQAIRKEFGTEILAHVLKKDIQEDAAEIAVIDGIRFQEEVDILKNLPGFHLIYVTAPLEERFKRIKGRQEKADDQGMTFEKFKEQETAATEVNIQNLKEDADEIINNDQSLEDFYLKIEEVYNKLK